MGWLVRRAGIHPFGERLTHFQRPQIVLASCSSRASVKANCSFQDERRVLLFHHRADADAFRGAAILNTRSLPLSAM